MPDNRSPDQTPLDLSQPDDNPRAVILVRRPRRPIQRYDLEQLFLEWAWNAGFPAGWWTHAVRSYVRTLRGLQAAGFVERRTIRRSGYPTHHGFRVTARGRHALVALSGDWIDEGTR